ncbi:MAG TPA: DUF2461 domain-containing protein [Chitinophagales bacterium]|nr:DUF2461 domain-containing protein [Chitinophagales bacterium]
MIQPSTLAFLRQLSRNNNREWFNANKHLYEAAKADFEKFVDELITAIGKFDKSVQGLQAKDCVFRIYRDVRFSKNKEPYKKNFGAYITSGGKKSMKPGYYIHVQPGGESFLAGGAYMPPPSVLSAIRQEIDYNQKEFERIIKSKSFVKYFKKLDGSRVKTAPKGYPKDHPSLELLKHKDFLAVHHLADSTLHSKNAIIRIAQAFRAMKPFNDFLARGYE